MFGTIAASGVRIVSKEALNRRAIMILAISLAVGLGVSQQPQILQFAPDWLKTLLSSGIAAGGLTAIILNLIFPPEKIIAETQSGAISLFDRNSAFNKLINNVI